MIKNLSKQQLIEVIKKGDDNLTNVIFIDREGNIHLFPYEKHEDNIDLFSHSFAVINSESFQPHNDYVGVNASKDCEFIKNEYNRLNRAWHEYLQTGAKQTTSDLYR